MQRSRAARWIVSVAALACACKRDAPPGALAVEFAGCRVVRTGPTCELDDDRRLSIWVPGFAPAVITVDGAPLATGAPVSAGAGRRHELAIPAGARLLTVEVRAERRAWRLPLVERNRAPVLAQAARLRIGGRGEDAAAALQRALPGLAAEDASRARALLARIAGGRGDVDAAIAGLDRAAKEARADGRLSHLVEDVTALVYMLSFQKHDLAAARARLDAVRSAAEAHATGLAQWHYLDGRISDHASDARGALAAFRRAEDLARRLALPRLASLLASELAVVLTRIGRVREAFEILAPAVDGLERGGAAAELPCNVAVVHLNLAWIAATGWRDPALRAPAGPIPPPAPLFARAHDRQRGCGDPAYRILLLVDEAAFAVETGDLATARARLDAMKALAVPRTPAFQVWREELAGRLALGGGDARGAVAPLGRAAALAHAAGLRDRALAAETMTGTALLRLGRRAEAAERLTVAERLLDELFDAVPFGEGRDTFNAVHDESARELVAALLALGRVDDAFAAARRARARVLRATAASEQLAVLDPPRRARWLEAMADYRSVRERLEADAARDWELSRDELEAAREARRPLEQRLRRSLDDAYRVLGPARTQSDLVSPSPDEAFVMPFRLGARDGDAERWIAFVARPGSLVARRLPAAPRAWPTALAPELAGTTHLRLLPHGAADVIDFHALPLRDGTVGDAFAVRYGMDIGAVARRGDAPRVALVVGDPDGDLPQARAEAADVGRWLAGWQTTTLVGPRAARDAILARLPVATLFHYAGHGTFAGLEGLDSALRAARGGRVLVADILAVPRVPRVVVLSACDAARAETGGVGLAHAFLARGATAVIAPTRPVRDVTGRALVAAFYREFVAGPALDPALALKGAQSELRRRFPPSVAADAASFRILIP